MDLDCAAQILHDRQDATVFLFNLYHAISGAPPYSVSDVVATLEIVLECVSEAMKAHDSIPFLSDGPFKWLWINEMTRHDLVLSSAFNQLDRLNKCVRGLKVLDDDSKILADCLSCGRIPERWLGEDRTIFSLKTSNFVRIINERTALYMVSKVVEDFYKGLQF